MYPVPATLPLLEMSLPVHNVMVMRPTVPTSSSPSTSAAWNSDSSADGGRAMVEQPSAKKRRRTQSTASASASAALPPPAAPYHTPSSSRPRSASGAPLSATVSEEKTVTIPHFDTICGQSDTVEL